MTNIKVEFWTEGNPNNFPDQLIYRSPNLCQRDELDFAIDVFYFMYNNHLYYAYINIADPKNQYELEFNEERKNEFIAFAQNWMVPYQNIPWRRFWISGKTIKQYYDYYTHLDEVHLKIFFLVYLDDLFSSLYDKSDDETTDYFVKMEAKHPLFKKYGLNYYKDFEKYLEFNPAKTAHLDEIQNSMISRNITPSDMLELNDEYSKVIYEAFKNKLGFAKFQFKQDILFTGRGFQIKDWIRRINYENSLFENFDESLEDWIKQMAFRDIEEYMNSSEFKEKARKQRENTKY